METRAREILIGIMEGTYDFKKLMKRKVPLTPEEREKAMNANCTWNHGLNGEPTCAIWKSSDASGNTVYGCNTHRAMQVKPTLAGAIKAFEFIKTTA